MKINEILKQRSIGGFKAQTLEEALKIDIPSQVISRGDLDNYLDKTKKGTKTKQDKLTQPYVHSQNVIATDADHYTTKSGDIKSTPRITKTDNPDDVWDMDELAAQITKRPNSKILGKNAKMTKSGKLLNKNTKMSTTSGEDIALFDITLPALSGLVVDEETGDFLMVQTCPNAGECKTYCYARKGGYVMFPASSMSAARWLNFLLNDPDGFMSQVDREIANKKKLNENTVVRWHDAGDFFSQEYFDMASKLADKHSDVLFYAYTKSADFALAKAPENFLLTFSTGAHHSQEAKVRKSKKKIKQSHVIKDDDFMAQFHKVGVDKSGNPTDDKSKMTFQYKSKAAVKKAKNIVAKEYNVNPKTVITYDEMLEIPQGNKLKWTVITLPTSGDIAAHRKDVLNNVLVYH